MLVAVLFIPVVAGNIFLESEFHRLPKISERNSKPEKTYTLFDPCNVKEAGKRPVTCAKLRMEGNNETAEYKIPLQKEFLVRCDMETDGGGWTVIQRRSYTETGNEFDRSEDDYNKGFHHSKSLSYWIGNEIIHELTTRPNKNQVLRIELTTEEGQKIIVDYQIFQVGSKDEGYKLTIGGYSSPNGLYYDALKNHNKGIFIIANEKNHKEPCHLSWMSGGWWMPTSGVCFQSNLNGRKKSRGLTESANYMYITWCDENDSNSYKNNYRQVEMKIRDFDYKFCSGEMAK